MAEQALWHLKRVTLAIPLPSVAALRGRGLDGRPAAAAWAADSPACNAPPGICVA